MTAEPASLVAEAFPRLQELDRAMALAFLASVPVGRLVFTESALPAVVPVNFVVDCSQIVVRTHPDSSIALSAAGGVVAFEADEVDVESRTGWSVLVIGRAHCVRDPLQLCRLRALPLLPWVGSDREAFVVVDLELVTGRRVGISPPPRQCSGTRHSTRVPRPGGATASTPQGPPSASARSRR